ncbi:hypothetical protein BANRA_05308 [Escherichia coli]|nr:hypothetical protein BANRA_05308 [Escherichia coli]
MPVRVDADRERQDIVTGETAADARIAEGRFTANREAVKREVERRVKERRFCHVTVITAGWPQLP